MAREFQEPELAYGDNLFARLKGHAERAGVEMIGDGETELTVGPAFHRSLTGNLVTRAGFPDEGVADEEFLHSLAGTPRGEGRKAVTLARHASGLLIASSGYEVSAGGDVNYDYKLRTLRTAEEPGQLVSARAVGHLTLALGTSSSGLLHTEQVFTELETTPTAYFTTGFNPADAERLFRQVVAANQ